MLCMASVFSQWWMLLVAILAIFSDQGFLVGH
jgi:hypothetical protein